MTDCCNLQCVHCSTITVVINFPQASQLTVHYGFYMYVRLTEQYYCSDFSITVQVHVIEAVTVKVFNLRLHEKLTYIARPVDKSSVAL